MAFSMRSLFGDSQNTRQMSLNSFRGGRELRLATTAGERTAVSTTTRPQDAIRTIVPPAAVIDHIMLEVYHQIRENLPIVDAAIKNRRVLEGHPIFTSDDDGLAEYLNEVARDLPVGFIGESATLRGLHRAINALSDASDEYGMGGLEVHLSENQREVEAVVVPSPRMLSLRDNRETARNDIWYHDRRANRRLRVDNLPTWSFLSFTYTSDSAWPVPMTWSLLKNSEIMLRALNSVASAWWRYGDPPNLFTMEFDKEANPTMVQVESDDGELVAEIPTALSNLMASSDAAYTAKLQGKVADIFTSITGGEVKVQTIGDVDQTLSRYYAEHMKYHDAVVVGLSETPKWMYPQLQSRGEGIGSNLSQNEALIASVAAERRQKERTRVARRVMDLYLVVTGDARYVGKYEIENESASIIDDKVEAETAKVRAEAEAQVIENTALLYDEDGKPRFMGEALEYFESRTQPAE